MQGKLITVFGGSGFIGSYIVKELAKTGANIQIVSRAPDRALFLKTSGPIGQIILTPGNIRDEQSIKRAVAGSYAVINATGILYETGKQRFASIHAQGPELLARIAKEEGVEKFIHFSVLGADKHTKSSYNRTKLNGEKAVRAAFPEASIIRPGLVFGAEDNFFNMFAAMTGFSPLLPLIGCGKTRFQPVYVNDIARAVRKILVTPFMEGTVIEMAGPRVYTFKQCMQLLLKVINKKRLLLPIPFPMATIMASFLELFPSPLLTRDQVQLLKRDTVIEAKKNDNVLTLSDLGIDTSALEVILPSYLECYAK